MLDNDVIDDRELSFRSLGLLTYILSRPDDWRIDSVALARTHQEGRDAVRASLTELEDAGYVIRRRVRSGSHWITETTVYDRPHDRSLNQADCSGDGFPGVGNPGVGNPGAVTSTETKDYDQVVPLRGTGTTSGRPATPKRAWAGRQPDEDDAAESPGFGADNTAQPSSPARPPRNAGRTPALPARVDRSALSAAAEAADTPYRCALRFKELGIKDKKIAPANLKEFAATFKQWYAEGLELDVLKTMVDIFAAKPESYMTGRQEIPWRAFINAREKLRADATKVSEARDPSRKFGTAYARAAAR